MACSIIIKDKTYTERQFKNLLKSGLLYESLERGVISLPINRATIVKPDTMAKTLVGMFPYNREDAVVSMKTIFGLTTVEANAAADIIDRMANSYAKRTGKTKEDFYKTITYAKPNDPNLTASNNLLYSQEEIAAIEKEKEQVKQDYKDTLYRAPNGARTNLTEDQWLTVRTPTFKAWFGNWENGQGSKAIDENGEPKVFYHGSDASWDVFDPEVAASKSPFKLAALFVSPEIEFAEGYVKTKQGSVTQFFVKSETPFDYENPAHLQLLKESNPLLHEELTKDVMKDIDVFGPSANNWSIMENSPMQQFLKENGFDGFYVKEWEVKNLAVYGQTQAKVADGRNQTFLENNPSILYQSYNGLANKIVLNGRDISNILDYTFIPSTFLGTISTNQPLLDYEGKLPNSIRKYKYSFPEYRSKILKDLKFAIDYTQKVINENKEKIVRPNGDISNMTAARVVKYEKQLDELNELYEYVDSNLLSYSDISINDNILFQKSPSQTIDAVVKGFNLTVSKNGFGMAFNTKNQKANPALASRINTWLDENNLKGVKFFYEKNYGTINAIVQPNPNLLFQIEAFHSSPYLFDKFSTDNIGTGEGNQSFGWGLYFSDSKAVRDYYKNSLSSKIQDIFDTRKKELESVLNKYNINTKFIKSVYREYIKYTTPQAVENIDNVLTLFKNTSTEYKELTLLKNALLESGVLDVDPNKIDDMFTYEVSLFKDKSVDEYKLLQYNEKASKDLIDKVNAKLLSFNAQIKSEVTNKELYNILAKDLGSQKAASLALQKLGIDGIQYPVGEFVKKDSGLSGNNYVIFNGDNVSINNRFDYAGNLLFQETPVKSYNTKVNNFFEVVKPELDKLAIKWADVFNKQRDLITIDNNDWAQISDKKEYNKLDKELSKIGKLILDLYGFAPQSIEDDGSVRFLELDKNTSEFVSEYISNSNEIIIFGKDTLGVTPRIIIDKNLNYRTENVPDNFLNQQAQAAILLGQDGLDIIYALSNPNVTSPLHEMAHKWERELTEEERAQVLNFAQENNIDISNGWTREISEAFARGFEKYLAEGVSPTPELEALFNKFKEWLVVIYKGIVGSEIDLNLNNDMRRIYASMLGENFTEAVKDEVAAEQAAPVEITGQPIDLFTRLSQPSGILGTQLNDTTAFNNGKNLVENLFASSEEGRQELLNIIDDLYNGMTRANIALKYDLDESQVSQIRTYLGIPSRSTPRINGVMAGTAEEIAESKELFQRWKDYIDSVKTGIPVQERQEQNLETEIEESVDWKSPITEDTVDKDSKKQAIILAYQNKAFDEAIDSGKLSIDEVEEIFTSAGLPIEYVDKILFRLTNPQATYNVEGLLNMKVNDVFQQVASYFMDSGLLYNAFKDGILSIDDAKELLDKITPDLTSEEYIIYRKSVEEAFEKKVKEQAEFEKNELLKRGGFSINQEVLYQGTKYIIVDEDRDGQKRFTGFILINPLNNKPASVTVDQIKEWSEELEKEYVLDNKIKALKEQLGEEPVEKKEEAKPGELPKQPNTQLKKDSKYPNLQFVNFNDLKGKGVSSSNYNQVLAIAKKFSAMFPFMDIQIVYSDEDVKGFVYGNKVTINIKNATQDTPIHELLHPFVLVLRQENPTLYNNLLSEFKANKNVYNAYIDDVRANEFYVIQSEEVQEEEAFIQYLGERIASLHDSKGRFIEPVVYVTKLKKSKPKKTNSALEEDVDENLDNLTEEELNALAIAEGESLVDEIVYEEGESQEYYESLGYEVVNELSTKPDMNGRVFTKIQMEHPMIASIRSSFMENFYKWFLDLLRGFKSSVKSGRKIVKFSEWNLAKYNPKKQKIEFWKPAGNRAERQEKQEILDEEGNVIETKIIKKSKKDQPSLTIDVDNLEQELTKRGASISEISEILNAIEGHRNETSVLNISLENSYVPGSDNLQKSLSSKSDDVGFFSTERKDVNISDLPVNMTINDLATLFGEYGNKLRFDLAPFSDALTELEAYQYSVKDAAKDLIERTKKRVNVLSATDNRIGIESSPTLRSESFAIKELLSKYNDVEFIEAYVRQGIGALSDASKIIKYIKEAINHGESTDEVMNQTLNRDLREAQALISFYDDVAALIEKNQDLFNQEELDSFNSIMTRATSRRKEINTIMVDLITDWLYPTISQSQKDSKDALPKEEFRKAVRTASEDVDFVSYWGQAPVNSKDPLMAALAIKIKDELNKNYNEESNSLQTLRVLYDEFLKSTGIANTASAVERYYKQNFLRKAKVWELVSIEKGGVKKYDYVERWAFHEEYLADVHAEARRQEIERLKRQLGEPNNYEERQAFNDRLSDWDRVNPLQSEKFRNPAFEGLKNNEYYMFLYNMYKKANDKYLDRKLSFGIIPQAYNSPTALAKGKNVATYVKDVLTGDGKAMDKIKELAVSSANALFDKDSFDKIQALNLDGSYHMSVKSPFTHLLDEEVLSFKLNESVYGFSTAANSYTILKSNQANIENLKLLINGNFKLGIEARKVLKNKIKTRDGKTGPQLVWDVVEGMPPQDKEQSEKKITKQLNSYINDVFYGVSEFNSEVNVGPVIISPNKIADNLGFFTALLNMAGNLLAGLSNITIGNVMSLGEAFGGKFYTPADWVKAQGIYFKELTLGKFLADAIDPVKSKITQLGIMHDAIQGEFRDKYGKNITGNVLQRYFTKDTLFIINHIAEHQIQLTGMLALMNATKVKLKDGSEISLYEAYVKNDKGFYKMREDAIWSNKQQQEFIRTLHGISRDLNGNYAAYDKAMIQRYALGKLALQYRKYLYTAWRTRIGRKRVDYEKGTTQEGYYRAFIKALYADIKQFNLNSLVRTLVDPRVSNRDITEEQKYAIRKTRFDIVMLIGLQLLATMLAGAEDEAEDEDEKYNLQLLLLWSLRLRSDMSSYSMTAPQELHKMITNPSASFNTVSKFAEFGGQLFNDIQNGQFETYERRTGNNEAGDLKVVGKFEKLVPLYRQWLRLQTPEDQLKYYDLINKNVKPDK